MTLVVAVDAFIDQLPGLVGVMIGVVLTYLLTSAGERARWRRDQQFRWDPSRLQIYGEYGDSVKRVAHVACRLAVARGFEHSAEAIPIEQGLAELNVATADRTARWENVLLLGSPATITAARAWHRSVGDLEFFARGILTDKAEWIRARDEFVLTRAEFYRCARRDLGVPGLDLPPTSWPSPLYQRLTQRRSSSTNEA
jgi:hypothetical protein